jgi:hypothetical protein
MSEETEKQKYALETYQNLGLNRSLRRLEKLTGITKSRLGRWAKELDWETKVKEFDSKQISGSDQQKALDDLMQRFKQPAENIERQEHIIINRLLNQCGIVLQTGFTKDEKTKQLTPNFEIKSVKDYVAILGAIRDLIGVIQKDRGTKATGVSSKKATTNIENLLVMLGDADESTQQKFITASYGTTLGGRDTGASGSSQKADFEEVSDSDTTED